MIPCSNNQLSWYASYLMDFMVYTSVTNYLQAVIWAHKIRELIPPCVSSVPVKLALAGIKRVGKISTRVREPVTVSMLFKLYSCLDLTRITHVLFWAIALLLFRSLLRVGHVVKSPHNLKCSDVILGEHGFLLRVKSSKTSRVPHDIPVAKVKDRRLCAFFWLRFWLTNRPKRSVYLFSDKVGNPISYQYFSSMLSQFLSRAGLDSTVTTHSFRHGGASFLASLGVPFSKIKERGGWRSNAVFSYLSEPLDSKIRSDFLVAESLGSQLCF